mmetsp:Transcript_11953/g.24291  ORF Transcript_11953/g.24291 Transcript_11953/m.24291 type:complete len:227 (-) Transcript_11953:168-848(-)
MVLSRCPEQRVQLGHGCAHAVEAQHQQHLPHAACAIEEVRGVSRLRYDLLLHPVELGALGQHRCRKPALGLLGLGLLGLRLALGLAGWRHADRREEEETLEAESLTVRLVVRVVHGPVYVLHQRVDQVGQQLRRHVDEALRDDQPERRLGIMQPRPHRLARGCLWKPLQDARGELLHALGLGVLLQAHGANEAVQVGVDAIALDERSHHGLLAEQVGKASGIDAVG